MTAHYTPGHTPGGTSWSWTSCERERCLRVVYADSQNPVAAEGFLFSRSSTYPSALQDFARGFDTLAKLKCDVMLTPHPEFTGVLASKAKRDKGQANAFIRPAGCRRYVAAMRRRLAARLEQESIAARR